jgi:hypothetical protein
VAKDEVVETVSGIYPIIDTEALAEEFKVNPAWIRNHTQPGHSDPIPHLKLGRYVRYEWGHPDLVKWLERQRRK